MASGEFVCVELKVNGRMENGEWRRENEGAMVLHSPFFF
jgi:hypothetical protein